ncbi:alpha-mannosidase-like isoform X2 [Magnolia sinica]|uniref:alpha-mannosidase-like isoform X2 n=1 Tax=Magnolia sinica TaxID=86752 RepID=UPI00265940AA|nr:alpha-mannosidase-like isoform X2 [Magnolia sinica]XP_058069973.1 alpha-mannosidase-like isoform X2 [Magnolia sinica]
MLSNHQIFTSAFIVHYSPRNGFHFEVNDESSPIQDDPRLYDDNVEQCINDFIDAARTQANVTHTNHIMWTMGDDFQYQYAESWFKQMDKFIHYVNKAVIYLDGDGCKLRSGLVKIEEGLTLDTLIAYDSCDLCKMTLMHHLCKRDLFCASDECLCTRPMSAEKGGRKHPRSDNIQAAWVLLTMMSSS